jgi:ABC-2 type transport system permease protein
LSLTAILTSPAFGFAGVGLPVLRWAVRKGMGALLPLRWYLQILIDQAARISDACLRLPFAILAGMALGLFALAWWRLRRLPAGRPEQHEEPLLTDSPPRPAPCVRR